MGDYRTCMHDLIRHRFHAEEFDNGWRCKEPALLNLNSENHAMLHVIDESRNVSLLYLNCGAEYVGLLILNQQSLQV